MDELIGFGRGPMFRFAIAIAILGLFRYAFLAMLGFARARSRTGERPVNMAAAIWRTVVWLNPFRYFRGNRRYYCVLCVVFHVGLILVPIFYHGHIRLWERGIGFGWPALPPSVADTLTLLTATSGVALLLSRLCSRPSSGIRTFQDWALPTLIVGVFVSGYLLAHPARNPLPLDVTMLVHVWGGNLFLVLTPFSPIVHLIMRPFSEFAVEMAWSPVAGAGRDAVKTLEKEGERT